MSRKLLVIEPEGRNLYGIEPSDLRHASDDELRAAVLPLIDYEAAAKHVWFAVRGERTEAWCREVTKEIVDAALGLKERE